MENIAPDTQAILERFHFDRIPFDVMREKIARTDPPELLHMITSKVTPPPVSIVQQLPQHGTEEYAALAREGTEMLRAGEVAVVVLAGGMATRFGSKIKGLCPLFDNEPVRFLDAKLADVAHASRSAGARDIPVALMTSFATDPAIREALGTMGARAVCAPQFVSLRLTAAGELFRTPTGEVSLHATGHGDLGEALDAAGLLTSWKQAGIRTILMSNVDNLGATLDPALLALHRRAKRPITVELVDKIAGDKGGLPVVYEDNIVLAEAFRLPPDFPHDAFPLFNTNTLWIDTEVLAQPASFTWCVVRKKVEGLEAVQLERLVGELTWWHPTTYVRVSRTGAHARFIPIKEQQDLTKAALQLREVLRERMGL